jgi:hypothetical protein
MDRALNVRSSDVTIMLVYIPLFEALRLLARNKPASLKIANKSGGAVVQFISW